MTRPMMLATACSMRQRLVAFNPDQVRDPHTGKWIDSSVITEKIIKSGEHSLRAQFHDNNSVTLHDDANGRSTRFTRKELNNAGGVYHEHNSSLKKHLHDVVDMKVGERTSKFSAFGIEKTSEPTPDTPGWDPEEDNVDLDTIKLHLGLPEGEDAGPNKENLFRGPGAHMTVGHAHNLLDKTDSAMSRVVRTSTGHGKVDIFPEGRNIVIRPHGENVPEWHMPIKDYRAMDKAILSVYDFDDEKDGVLTRSQDVDTAIGSFTVQAWRDEAGSVIKVSIQPHFQDYQLDTTPGSTLRFVDDFGDPIGRN